jgi:serine/threonine protein kinase
MLLSGKGKMTVKCPKCHAENPASQKFCGHCATSLLPDLEGSFTKTMETPAEGLSTGSTFAGRFQIIEELGQGGMGKVYKVHDTEIKDKVAIKLLKREIASDWKTIERFRNEIRLARKIAHKNVGRTFDIGKSGDHYFIAMEYVEGQDLKGLIRQSGHLALDTSIKIAKEICEGLTEAHRMGVVHRDLKPGNIMIDREGSVRIMDFGIALSRTEKGEELTGEGMMIGTPVYMSPEQAEALRDAHRPSSL